jgi:hypothetical protein
MRGRGAKIAGGLAAAATTVALAGCQDTGPPFGGKKYPATGAPSTPTQFKPSSVRGFWYFNEPYGQRREVHFIASGPFAAQPHEARLCVQWYLDHDVTAPFCYAYASERAFRAAHFKASNGQTGPSCWSARAQKPKDDKAISEELADSSALGNEGCPDQPPRK